MKLLWALAVLRLVVVDRGISTKQQQTDIIFPKAFDENCFLDEEKRVPGICKKQEDCSDALSLWINLNLQPAKTCYFNKSDQYVCCAQNVISTTTIATTPKKEDFSDPLKAPSVKRSSLLACYRYHYAFIDGDHLSFYAFAVNGQPTTYREFPYMVALGWPTNFDKKIDYRCGGVLISRKFILTAAHCTNFGGLYPNTVRLGGDNLTATSGEDYKIKRVIVHPDYVPNSPYNDIALLELDSKGGTKLRPACLWVHPELAKNDLTAIGYGQTRFGGLPSAQLLKVPLNWITEDTCRPHYPEDVLPEGLKESQICAGDPLRQFDTCQGDSGGPLLMKHYFPYVVGVTSLGLGCASGPPSIYTRVAAYLDWIEDIVWPNASQFDDDS